MAAANERLRKSGHTSWASIEPVALLVDTPPSFPHILGTFTVPITRQWQFSIFVVLSIIALVIDHCHGRGSGASGGPSHRHQRAWMLVIGPTSL